MAAGNIIARHTGAEAGLVTSGAAGGLILQASAVIAGNDPAKMKRLPDTQGLIKVTGSPMTNTTASVGAKFVEIGDGRRCHEWELEAAFTECTAAVA